MCSHRRKQLSCLCQSFSMNSHKVILKGRYVEHGNVCNYSHGDVSEKLCIWGKNWKGKQLKTNNFFKGGEKALKESLFLKLFKCFFTICILLWVMYLCFPTVRTLLHLFASIILLTCYIYLYLIITSPSLPTRQWTPWVLLFVFPAPNTDLEHKSYSIIVWSMSALMNR